VQTTLCTIHMNTVSFCRVSLYCSSGHYSARTSFNKLRKYTDPFRYAFSRGFSDYRSAFQRTSHLIFSVRPRIVGQFNGLHDKHSKPTCYKSGFPPHHCFSSEDFVWSTRKNGFILVHWSITIYFFELILHFYPRTHYRLWLQTPHFFYTMF